MNRVLELLKLVIASLGYYALAVFDFRRKHSISWVIGVEEIASVVRQISDAIPGSYSFVVKRHLYYDHHYDEVRTQVRGSIQSTLENIVFRPLAFARLVHRSQGFVYVGTKGFLGLAGGSRSAEFRFIKKRKRGLVLYFTGSDIRSPKLLRELEMKTGVPNVASALQEAGEVFSTAEYEAMRVRVAAEADRWADAIYTARVDQLSYLSRSTEPFLYFIPDDDFLSSSVKFDSAERLTVLHAPSSQEIKGTRFVREAVEALHAEGYHFDYVELSHVPHAEVKDVLARAHIVLNQFYAFMPGMFGVESLASRCAVLMSADSEIETDLPPGSNSAWIVTRCNQITENLRSLLENPTRALHVANSGYEWAKAYASASSSSTRLNFVLQSVLDGTYSEPLGWQEISKKAV